MSSKGDRGGQKVNTVFEVKFYFITKTRVTLV
jgi:hypothetical protein